MLKTKEHFDEARHDNKDKFQKLDSNHDGILTWNEYLVEFLGNKKYDRYVFDILYCSRLYH